MTTELPPEILFSDILQRLPAKSLSRFKCVSKQWHSFLRSPRFLQMHILHVNNNQNDKKLLFLPNTRPWVFRTVDCETPRDGFTASRPIPFEVEVGQQISIITSLNGMVCVGITKPYPKDREYSDLILWNPVTGDHMTLPKPRCHQSYNINFRYELYYSFSENDYKLVWLSRSKHRHLHVHIFSLKSNSWRRVRSKGSQSNFDRVSYHIISSVMLNEKFHFLREFFEFEGGDEKVSVGNDQRRDFIGFVVLKGLRYFCVAIINSKGEYDTIELLWRMSGPERCLEMVTKEHLFISDGDPITHMMIRNGDKLLHSMRNGNWLMYSRNKEYVYVIDRKIKPTKDIMRSINVNVAFRPGGKYIETVVSPNQYMI